MDAIIFDNDRHGFLLWTNQKTAMALPGSFEVNIAQRPLVVVCGGKALGEVMLARPADMTVEEFDRKEFFNRHQVRRSERLAWWPTESTMKVFDIERFDPYPQVRPVPTVAAVGYAADLVDWDAVALEIQASKEVVAMPWTKDDPPSVAKNWTDEEKEKCIAAANAMMEEKDDEEQAIYACIHAAGRGKKALEALTEERVIPYEGLTLDEGALEEPLVLEDGLKARWTVAYMNDLPDSAFLYVEDGDKDEQGRTKPRSLRHFPYKDAAGEVDLPHLRNAIARIPQAKDKDGKAFSQALVTRLQNKARAILEKETDGGEKEGRRIRRTVLDRIKEALRTLAEVITFAEPEEEGLLNLFKGFGSGESGCAVKEIGGEPVFLTWSTNAFMDRDKEIFSTASLERYVAAAEKGADRGTFNFWHIPGTDFARKEWQGVVGRFLLEGGHFVEDDIGTRAKEFFMQYPDGHPTIAPDGWGCSPEYRYRPAERATGVYENIYITKTSTLPRHKAANAWTVLTNVEANKMLTKEQKDGLVTLLGDEALANTIIDAAEQQTKALEGAGIAHKAAEGPPASVPPATVEIDLEALAETLSKQLSLNIEPLTTMLDGITTQFDALIQRVMALEKEEAVKQETELPRYVLSLTRAANAGETAVGEKDPLRDMKPKETRTDTSAAQHFFGRK